MIIAGTWKVPRVFRFLISTCWWNKNSTFCRDEFNVMEDADLFPNSFRLPSFWLLKTSSVVSQKGGGGTRYYALREIWYTSLIHLWLENRNFFTACILYFINQQCKSKWAITYLTSNNKVFLTLKTIQEKWINSKVDLFAFINKKCLPFHILTLKSGKCAAFSESISISPYTSSYRKL